jgi:delta 1-pyrroline-5-carboxylate dehydrogenase
MTNDAYDYYNDNQLRQLKPMLATGGTTPAITPSPRPGVDDCIEDLLSLKFDSATRRQSELRRICLQRDNYQCVVTKAW